MAFQTLFHEVLLPDRLEYGMRIMSGDFNESISYGASGYRTANVPWSEDLRMWNVSFNTESQAQALDLMKFHQNRKGRAYGFRIWDHFDFQATDENFGRGDGSETEFNLRKIYRDTAGQITDSDIDFANTDSRVTSGTSGFFKDVLADSLIYISGATDNANNGLFQVSAVDTSGGYIDLVESGGGAADITTRDEVSNEITFDLFVTTKRIYKVMNGRFVDSDYPFSVEESGVTKSVTLNENTGLVTFSVAPADGAELTWSGGHHWPVAFKEKRLKIDFVKFGRLDLPDLVVEEVKIYTS